MARIAPISGFPEWLPAQRIVEQHFEDVIRETFELHGFCSVQTRSVEPLDRLLHQGEDADKEIYTVSRLAGADDPASSGGSVGRRLGLHFDLTVPLARYVLENAGRLTFPFRRYQIAKSWRGERPQEGRYREFTQCDIDVVDVGSLPAHVEAEIPLVIIDVFGRLPVGEFVIQVNNRKIAEGFYRGIGLTDVAGVLRTVDKLDKIGPAAVTEVLLAGGATAPQADLVLRLARIRAGDASVAEQVRALGVRDPLLETGLSELTAVLDAANAVAPGRLVADLAIARGLDYYTGTVYETQLVGHESWGSLCSGGRYDALASDGRVSYPGVGISIGLTRLLALLFAHDLVGASRSTPACVLVALNTEDDRARSTAVATRLRARGIACEVAPRAARFGRQIEYAGKRGIPYVWFPGRVQAGADRGPDEGHGDEVKDIRSGQQVPADPDTWRPPARDLKPTVRGPAA